MREFRMGLDAETAVLYKELREATGYQVKRGDSRLMQEILELLHTLQAHGLLEICPGSTPVLTLTLPSSDRAPGEGLTAEQLLTALELSAEESEAILHRAAHSYGSVQALVRACVLKDLENAKDVVTRLAKDEVDITDGEQRGRRKGAGLAYIEQVVQGLIEQNLRATHIGEKVYISQVLVTKLTGSNWYDIKEYFTTRSTMLDAHNQAMGFLSDKQGHLHNRSRLKQLRLKSVGALVE